VVTAGLLALLAAAAVLLLRPPDFDRRILPSGWSAPGWRPGQAQARRAAELEWVEALVAELRSGRDPVSALVASAVAAPTPVVPRALVAARGGGDVSPALADDAAGSELLRGTAACWAVAQGSGAGLAAALVSLADSARAAERVRRELHAGLAEPRATALVLAGLPLVGLLMGTALGADPLGWLLGSTAGLVVLVLGLLLEGLGAWWAWRIATRLEAAL
jgi:tight adherence protein B